MMHHDNPKNLSRLSVAVAIIALLSACGGGGGSSGGSSTGGSTNSTSSSTSSTPVPGTVSTPQYVASSAQLAAFTLLNSQRQQCGFPALQENTYLDQAANGHAAYEQANSTTSDTEVSTNAGFTGATYTDRAMHFGFPSGISVGGVSGAFSGTSSTETQYGQSFVYAALSGVYHAPVLMLPVSTVGVGELDRTSAGTTTVWGSMSFANLQTMTSNSPLTFPCQGTTGVAYEGVSENPTPPNTSGSWGTPIVVMGNPSDTIVLTSGTIVPTAGGSVTNLQLLDSANDPNHELQPYEASAYPSTPLSANTQYTYSLNGTVNGKVFSRNYTFTTGNIIQ